MVTVSDDPREAAAIFFSEKPPPPPPAPAACWPAPVAAVPPPAPPAPIDQDDREVEVGGLVPGVVGRVDADGVEARGPECDALVGPVIRLDQGHARPGQELARSGRPAVVSLAVTFTFSSDPTVEVPASTTFTPSQISSPASPALTVGEVSGCPVISTVTAAPSRSGRRTGPA